jgi:murein DD-endopeptidase MepM/ murein hydrolase activator NlpD
VNNSSYKSLFLGLSVAIIATVSYKLTLPENTDTKLGSISATLPIPASLNIEQSVISRAETTKPELLTVSHKIKPISHKTKPGESISSIFSKLDLSTTDLHNVIHANKLGKLFASIKPGKELLISTDSKNQLQQLVYKKDSTESLKATRIDDSFKVVIINTSTETAITGAKASTNSSLYPDHKEPNISDITKRELKTISHKINPGESLSIIFSKLDLRKSDLHKIIHANKIGKQFTTIRSGNKLLATIDSSNQLQQLIYKKDHTDTLKATRTDDSFNVEIISKPIERKISSAQTTINSSLYLDGKEAGLSDGRMMELISIFAWDIDFALDVRQGDQFTVVYEKIYVDDMEIFSGKSLADNIISAEFVNQGKTYTAVRFKDKKGNTSYFTPEGKSMRKTFLRTPIAHARVSSHFNLKRKHPVLNRIRAHKGVDYAARTGTNIKTTGDGKIVFRGRKGGYGRVVIVQHGQKYNTLYAHMSNYRKGQKVGQQVKQGTTIGYVGKSGLATGPHLHYEFRVNGVHRNPLTVKLPNTQPIKKSLLAEFKKQTQPLIAQLNKAKASTLLAQNKH